MIQASSMIRKRVSVALCCYNGGAFLRTQLDSLIKQSRLPDELIISDDGSNDDSLMIIDEFSKNAPFPVVLFHQANRLGSTKNFEFAIGKCSGDIICLCDQDDNWLPEKIEVIEKNFYSSPEIGWMFTDGFIADENLINSQERLWSRVQFFKKEKRELLRNPLKVLMKHNVVTGAALAFKKDLVPFFSPISPHWVHDAWIAAILSAVSPCVIIDKPLFLYRQHSGQQLGAVKQGFFKKIREIDDYSSIYHVREAEKFKELLDVFCQLGLSDNFIQEIQGKIDHLEARAKIIKKESGWFSLWVREIFSNRYNRYSSGIQSMVRDVMFS